MAMYYNGKKVRNLYIGTKCITRLALGKELTRLVEGDDYVTADWLVGDGSAYISHQYNVWQNRLECEVYFNEYAGNNRRYIACSGSDYNCSITASTESENYYLMVIYRNDAEGTSHIKDIRTQGRYLINLYQNNNKSYADISGVTYNGRTIYENTWNTDKEFKIYSKKLSYIREVLPNGKYRSNLTPCRLLRPIPAALDGNGIARNAGECGMFDAVSGKFYGNVANSGSFTVEPSLVEGVDYERHKWLVGDGSTYIDTLQVLTATDIVETKFGCIDIPQSYYILYGNNSGSFTTTACVLFSNSFMAFRPTGTSTSYQIAYNAETICELSHSTTEIKVDGNIVWQGQDVFSAQSVHCCLFASGTDQNHNFNGKISYFRIQDKLNLIPVRLLRPLPSYLDANGKARKQFECGMLDLKTRKFYGNVNTSGKFTVSDN